MCGLFQLLSTSRGYHRAKFCSYMTSSWSRTLEKRRKNACFRVKISHFQVIFRPLRGGTGQNLMKHGWKKFSADSEYRIRFFIAFTVLELLDDLWTSFWPFWPKMTTLWMNNSRTEQNLDMRFSRAVQYWLVLHSGAFWLKSLEPFLRKRRKTLILTTFSYFMDEPDFFRTNRRVRFFL